MSRSPSPAILVTIFFDYESTWGMPEVRPYDLAATTRRLLETLAKHQVKAVFNTTGKIVEEHPNLIRQIHAEGHEIAIHGYDHTSPAHMTRTDHKRFERDLGWIERLIVKITAQPPTGFRSPNLAAPHFADPTTYDIFETRHYLWASNRELQYIDEATSPRLRATGGLLGTLGRLIHTLRFDRYSLTRRLAFFALNLPLLIKDPPALRTLVSAAPFRRGLLTEIPILSPLDCDLLGDQIIPDTPSPVEQIDHHVYALCRGFDQAAHYYNINFHDWIIGTSNRLEILDRTLAYIRQDPRARWTLARELVLPTRHTP